MSRRRVFNWHVQDLTVSKRNRSSTDSSDNTLESESMEMSGSPSGMEKLAQLMCTLTSNVNSLAAQKRGSAGSECIPLFHPDDKVQDINKWIKKIEELKLIHGWDDGTTSHFATSRLRGYAATWYNSLPSINYVWSDWKVKLTAAFPTEIDFASTLDSMMKRTKRNSESMMAYYYEKLSLLNICEIYGAKAVSCIIAGIPDKNVQRTAKVGDYKSPEELLKYLKTIDDKYEGDLTTNHSKTRASIDMRRNYGHRHKIRDHQEAKDNRKCYGCGSREHTLPNCPKKIKKCGKCNRYHAGDCNVTKRYNEGKQIFSLEEDKQNGEKYFMNVTINGHQTKAFIDLGANVNTMRHDILEKLGMKVDSKTSLIRGFGGGELLTKGRITDVRVVIDQATAFTNFTVVPNEVQNIPVIIGQPFTEQSHIVVHKDNNSLRIYENFKDDLPSVIDLPPTKIPLWAKTATIIPAKHTQNIVCHADHKGDIFVETSVRMEEFNEHFLLRCITHSDEDGDCVLPFVNTSDRDIIIKPNKILARGEKCVESVGVGKDRVSKINADTINLNKDLSQGQQKKVIRILQNYKDCFATSLKDIGCTNAIELTIELEDEKPVTYRPYRMSPSDREKVKTIVDELLDCGIVRESTSPFSSPVLLVKKKNGQDRLCIDYRKLNAKIRQNRFPLPRIDDQINQLQGHKYFTTLDMTSGYYQIPIEENSRSKTAFVTCDGQYEFIRMPFGISTAPGMFQRMVNKILGPLRGTIATAYLDDILIPSKDFNEGMKRLENILNILRKHNLTLNPTKCHFFKTTIDYLGFEISKEGMRPGSGKTKAIEEFPTPNNVHKIRQFLGLTGFFRQFVENYAHIAKPLTKMIKKDQQWKWELEQENAFKELKRRLIERPLLAIYNPKAATEIHTDASQKGIAGILLQGQENSKFQPVAYYSRQTTPAEQKYHSYELETLAIVETLKKFRIYLLDIQFKVVTDCNAIKAAATKRDLVPRIARWWLLLQEFTFTVEYRAGTKMTHVDALSRNAVETDSPLENQDVLRIEVADWVLAGQLNDDKIKLIHEILQKKSETEYEKKIQEEYCLRDNRVYKKTKDGDKWLVPKDMREQILRASHDEFGHFGVEKTLRKICENYWFPKMRERVQRYINNCIPCIFHKKPKGKLQGELYPIEKNINPFHTIHLDHLGPFVRSTTGKRYLIVGVDSLTKYVMLKAVKDTTTTPVLRMIDQIIAIFGVPLRIITDKGTCYTSKAFFKYCDGKGIQHVQNAVATPRANGQVERFNSTILSSLATSAKKDRHWDREIDKIQFAINNTVHSVTKRTPSELLFGYRPRAISDANLSSEVSEERTIIKDLNEVRREVLDRIRKDQLKQKERFDKKRKPARKYKEGDLVVVQKQTFGDGQSRKLLPKYKGPFKIKKVIGRDRYVVAELPGSYRSQRAPYENVESADHIKPWVMAENKSSEESTAEEE